MTLAKEEIPGSGDLIDPGGETDNPASCVNLLFEAPLENFVEDEMVYWQGFRDSADGDAVLKERFPPAPARPSVPTWSGDWRDLFRFLRQLRAYAEAMRDYTRAYAAWRRDVRALERAPVFHGTVNGMPTTISLDRAPRFRDNRVETFDAGIKYQAGPMPITQTHVFAETDASSNQFRAVLAEEPENTLTMNIFVPVDPSVDARDAVQCWFTPRQSLPDDPKLVEPANGKASLAFEEAVEGVDTEIRIVAIEKNGAWVAPVNGKIELDETIVDRILVETRYVFQNGGIASLRGLPMTETEANSRVFRLVFTVTGGGNGAGGDAGVWSVKKGAVHTSAAWFNQPVGVRVRGISGQVAEELQFEIDDEHIFDLETMPDGYCYPKGGSTAFITVVEDVDDPDKIKKFDKFMTFLDGEMQETTKTKLKKRIAKIKKKNEDSKNAWIKAGAYVLEPDIDTDSDNDGKIANKDDPFEMYRPGKIIFLDRAGDLPYGEEPTSENDDMGQIVISMPKGTDKQEKILKDKAVLRVEIIQANKKADRIGEAALYEDDKKQDPFVLKQDVKVDDSILQGRSVYIDGTERGGVDVILHLLIPLTNKGKVALTPVAQDRITIHVAKTMSWSPAPRMLMSWIGYRRKHTQGVDSVHTILNEYGFRDGLNELDKPDYQEKFRYDYDKQGRNVKRENRTPENWMKLKDAGVLVLYGHGSVDDLDGEYDHRAGIWFMARDFYNGERKALEWVKSADIPKYENIEGEYYTKDLEGTGIDIAPFRHDDIMREGHAVWFHRDWFRREWAETLNKNRAIVILLSCNLGMNEDSLVYHIGGRTRFAFNGKGDNIASEDAMMKLFLRMADKPRGGGAEYEDKNEEISPQEREC